MAGCSVVIRITLIVAWLWQIVRGSENYDERVSLDSYFYDNAFEEIHNPRTGKLYDVSLPANLSGVQVSFVRLRARNLWRSGANHSLFAIPPSVLPFPFAKRVDLVYQNLGNRSSNYYSVPDYEFVAPVVGFLAYDSNKSSINYGLIELKLMRDDPIIVHFPDIFVEENGMKCVRFDANGPIELSNVEAKNSCFVRRQGHFSVVVPYQEKKDKVVIINKWWMIVGIACGGVVGLIILIVVIFVAYKWIKRKRIKKMERQTERNEGLDTIWIGRSRMPSATCVRTQPVLENSYLP
ncbi:hypothetical protein ABFX02_14G140300 [Erythranthe guttata]